MSGIDLGVWLTISSLMIGAYVTLIKRQDTQNTTLGQRIDKTEECVEDKFGEVMAQITFFREAQRDFQEKVVDRLARIEARLNEGNRQDAIRPRRSS